MKTTLRSRLALLLVAAGAVLAAHAQPTDEADAARRARNREEVMLRRMQADREGGTSVTPPVRAQPLYHGHRHYGHGRHVHHLRHHRGYHHHHHHHHYRHHHRHMHRHHGR